MRLAERPRRNPQFFENMIRIDVEELAGAVKRDNQNLKEKAV
jgi:hypothetical protein